MALISILSQVIHLYPLDSGGSAEEISDTESLPSTARPATSRSQSHAAGPTRAIARTQQSERVRANVNRHRITQARTSQVWHEAWRFSLGLFSNSHSQLICEAGFYRTVLMLNSVCGCADEINWLTKLCIWSATDSRNDSMCFWHLLDLIVWNVFVDERCMCFERSAWIVRICERDPVEWCKPFLTSWLPHIWFSPLGLMRLSMLWWLGSTRLCIYETSHLGSHQPAGERLVSKHRHQNT